MALQMISTVVMAHERRKEQAEDLAEVLDCEIVWDKINSRWETGKRSLLAFDPSADWHLVVQDDVILCSEFLEGVHAALSAAPEVPVSFYTGKVRPHGAQIAEAVQRANQLGTRWLSMPGPLWGPALAIPASHIEQLVEYADRLNVPNYDLRIGRFYQREGLNCWYSLPSLVDHLTGPDHPSLVAGRSSHPARTAHSFIGDVSPLSIDWKTKPLVVDLRAGAITPMKRIKSMTIAKKRIYGTDSKGRRVLVAAAGQRIPKGFNIDAEQSSPKVKPKAAAQDFSKLKQPQLKRLCDKRGIEYPKGPVKNALLVELLEKAERE